MKRCFDVFFSLLVLALFLPFGLVLAVILRLTGEGEIFYSSPRVGLGSREFGLLKFATMLKDSPSLGTGDITVHNDPRVLPVGRFLRRTKINEVPQVLNILRGEMSVVGPRPLTPKNFSYYPRRVRQALAGLQPGLTGVGSVYFRDEEAILGASPKSHEDCYREDIAPRKGELELWYKRHRSFALDMKIVFLTAWVVLFPGSRLHQRWLPVPEAAAEGGEVSRPRPAGP